jgi:hypothetical protein
MKGQSGKVLLVNRDKSLYRSIEMYVNIIPYEALDGLL